MKRLFAIILSSLLIFGVYFPAFPISDIVLYRTSTAVILFVAAIVAINDRKLSLTYLPALALFVCVICGLPFLMKGTYQFAVELFISGILGYLAYRYLRFQRAIIVFIYLLCLYFIGYFIINGSLDDVFVPGGDKDGVSRNYVQISLLHLYLVYYVTCLRSKGSPSHLPFFVFPCVAFISAGMSSTVVSLILLIGFLLILFRVNIAKGAAVSVAFIVLIYFLQNIFVESELITRIESGFVGLDRIILISSFIDQLDLKSMIVGFDEGVVFHPSVFADFGTATRNVHNSYFNLYRDVGVLSLLYLAIVFYTALQMFRINNVLALIFSGTLLRAFTDGYYFQWYTFDFIIFYLFLMTPAGIWIFRLAPNLEFKKIATSRRGLFPHKARIS